MGCEPAAIKSPEPDITQLRRVSAVRLLVVSTTNAANAKQTAGDGAANTRDQRKVRHAQRQELLDARDQAYPIEVTRHHSLASIREKYTNNQSDKEKDE